MKLLDKLRGKPAYISILIGIATWLFFVIALYFDFGTTEQDEIEFNIVSEIIAYLITFFLIGLGGVGLYYSFVSYKKNLLAKAFAVIGGFLSFFFIFFFIFGIAIALWGHV